MKTTDERKMKKTKNEKQTKAELQIRIANSSVCPIHKKSRLLKISTYKTSLLSQLKKCYIMNWEPQLNSYQ